MLLRRAAGYFVDATISFLVAMLLQLAVWVPLREALGIGTDWFYSGWNTELYTLLTISLPVWAYFIYFQTGGRSTLGMKLVKLQVCDLRSNQTLSIYQAFLRTLVLLLPWELAHITNNLPKPLWYDPQPEFRAGFVLVGLLGALNMAFILFRADHRGLHDIVAGTQMQREVVA